MVSSRINFTKEDIGAEILPILTTGLYRNTLDALREYVQNAVDADADSIAIDIDPDVVSIVDTGSGMSSEQARNAIRFGVSDKSPLEHVGFRGIGIYSGFNVCDSLEIYTKTGCDPNTYKLTFDFYGIRTQLLREQERRSLGLPPELHLERLLEQSVFMESIGEEAFRRRGTTVIMSGLLESAYSQLNDWDTVIEYLRNVVPLPFDPGFRYGSLVEKRFQERDYKAVPITLTLNGRKEALFRPYTDSLFKNGGRHPPQFFEVKVVKGRSSQEFGFAWVCVNDARETIKDRNLRGLLLKKLGFSISNRQYLEPFFTRPTYSRRITGEVILTHERLIPNAARNDFENNSTLQEFMVQLPRLTRDIDKWANEIQESERASEVLSQSIEKLAEIDAQLPAFQRDRKRLLEFNVRVAEIERAMRPHRRRLTRLNPKGLAEYQESLGGVQKLVNAGLTVSRGRARRIEQEVARAIQREASSPEVTEASESVDIASLIEQYLPLDEQKWLTAIRLLDEAIQHQNLDLDVYQAIVEAFRYQLDAQI